MKLKSILVLVLMFASASTIAEPSVLIIDKSIKRSASEKWIKAVHQEMPVQGKKIAQIRYAILEGMINTRGYRWLFEGEGEGYILARFDYRGDTNVMRIEYSESLVQLKYHDALGDFICEKLVDGICYKNERGYYNYIKNLRKSVALQLEKI